MKNKKKNQLEDLKGFYDEIQSESPRAAVIVSCAFLDAQLRKLISLFLVNDSKVVDELLGTEDKSDGPLSSFSARIKTSYCLGLISKPMFDDLTNIRKIRNKFAHELHGYTLEEPEIISWCNSLKIPTPLLNFIDDKKTPGNMFLLGVTQLSQRIALSSLSIETKKRIIPNEPEMKMAFSV